jgi:nitroreductase
MNFNTEQINELIRYRRSILPNFYTGEVIDDRIVNQIIENATWAPNHKNTEPWRFVVFKGEGLQKLSDFQSELYKKVATAAGTFKEEKYIELKSKPLKASHVIAIGMKRNEKEIIPEIEEISAVACAVQNMYLTATAYGAGSYWGTGGITYMSQAKEFFGLEEKDKLMGFFYLGMPRKWPNGKRSPAEEKTRWVN